MISVPRPVLSSVRAEQCRANSGKNDDVKHDNNSQPDEGCLCPVGFARMGAAAEPPDEQHDDVDERDRSNQNGHEPVADRDRLLILHGIVILVRILVLVLELGLVFHFSLDFGCPTRVAFRFRPV